MFGAEPLAADGIHPHTLQMMKQFAEPMPLFDEKEELELESSHPRKRMKKDEPEKEEKYLDDKEINDRIQAGKPESNAVAIKNEKFLPPPKVTIVDSDTIQIAACMSQQIYSVNTEEDFKLKTEMGKDAKVVLLEKHGRFNPAVPAFAMATFNKTLMIAFRGTNQILDVITDVSYAPVSSPELGDAAKGIRCHASMAGLASR